MGGDSCRGRFLRSLNFKTENENESNNNESKHTYRKKRKKQKEKNAQNPIAQTLTGKSGVAQAATEAPAKARSEARPREEAPASESATKHHTGSIRRRDDHNRSGFDYFYP